MLMRLVLAAALIGVLSSMSEVKAGTIEGLVVANCLDPSSKHQIGDTTLLTVLPDGRLCVGGIAPYPESATPVAASSGNMPNAVAVATLPAAANKLTYISGFQCTSTGSDVVLGVTITVVGVVGGQLDYAFNTGDNKVAGDQMIVPYSMPMPANAVNTPIVVSMPANGLGNTHASCTAQGFQLPNQ